MNMLYVRLAGDNDFASNTILPFMKTIAPKILLGQGDWETITKAELVSLFNDHIFSFYVLDQADLKDTVRNSSPKTLKII